MSTAAFALIAHPTRAAILRETWTAERAAGEIARKFSVTFGAVSQHLKLLLDAGLLRLRRDGRRRFYQADRAALGPLAAALEQMWATQLLVLKEKAEAAEAAVRVDHARTESSRPEPPRRRGELAAKNLQRRGRVPVRSPKPPRKPRRKPSE